MAEQFERIQIIEKILELISNKATGTFFIKTATSHLAVFIFEQGKIISLTYSHFRGVKALPHIARINSGQCSFKTTVLGIAQKDIPSTREIIHQLENTSGKAQDCCQKDKPSVPQSHLEPPVIEPQESPRFSEEELINGIAKILLNYIGPISAIICQNVASEIGGVNDLGHAKTFISNLAADISDSSDQKHFKSDASLFVKKLIS